MTRDIVLLDLFSGIGGFSLGLRQAGFNIVKDYYSEIDKHAIAIYKQQFKDSEYVGSVTSLDGRSITRPNIITFGSPCQDFSLAGKRSGLGGERSSLVGEAIRLIAECRPDVFVWENVKGVFSSNNRRDFWAVIQAFTNIGGYRLEWQLLNTKWLLPQNRERVYLVGHLAEDGRDWRGVFPFREDDFGVNERPTKTTINTISGGGHSGGMHSGMTLIIDPNYHKDGLRQYEDVCSTLNQRDYKDPKIVVQINPDITSGGKQPYQQDRVYDSSGLAPVLHSLTSRMNVLIGDTKTARVMSSCIKTEDEISPAITASNCSKNANNQPWIVASPTLHGFEHGTNGQFDKQLVAGGMIRRLTEIECERLQGYPDNFTKYGNYDGLIKQVSKTQRYKALGNAVTVAVVKEIGKRLLNNL
jgi:DNA (cytosine-5)-methyltransferase 1